MTDNKENGIGSTSSTNDSCNNKFAELAKFDTDKKIAGFRRDLLLSLNIMLLAITSHRAIVNSMLGEHLLMSVHLITFVACLPTLVLIWKNSNLEKSAFALGSAALAGFVTVLLLSDNSIVTNLVAAPAVIALTTIFFSGRAIYASAVLLITAIGWSIAPLYSSNSLPITISAETLKHSFAPGIIMTLSMVFYVFIRFRSAHEKSRKSILEEQIRASKANHDLAALIVRHELNTKSQIKLQHAGKMSGWWVDVNAKLLSIGIKASDGNFEIMDIPLTDSLELSVTAKLDSQWEDRVPFWRDCIHPRIIQALENEAGWDDEIERDVTPNANPYWFRSIGDIECDTDGVTYIFGVTQDITSTKQLTQQLEYRANFDSLTDLNNRQSLELILENTLKLSNSESNSYYLFIDLDRFKVVNDTSGHLAGDELLKIVAKIIRNNLRKCDYAGRIGGDEFGVLLNNIDETSAISTANRIRQEIESLAFTWENDLHRIGASIGAVKVSSDIPNIDTLQLLTDNACLEAKNEGRNRVKLSQTNNESAINRQASSRWLLRIQDALRTGNFALCIQAIKPTVKTQKTHFNKTQEVFEVLIRMRAPDGEGLIAPGAFLPIAERYNLCSEIDLWVANEVIEIAQSQQTGSPNNTAAYWINLSGQSISNQQFFDKIVALIKAANLPKGTINFEITETAVIRDITAAVSLMTRLKALGCLFALDDFGSGLASFGYLKQLPVDIIKIDGMFIKEINEGDLDRVFTKSIIDVAHAIGIQTVAEFVEDDVIGDAVTKLGVDYLQGFGIHRPEEIALATEENQQKAS